MAEGSVQEEAAEEAEPIGDPEAPSSRSDSKLARRKWTRLFEGWQAGLIVVSCAVLMAALVAPRAVDPQEIPLPRVDWEQLGVERGEDRARVEAARTAELPYEARAVGEALRQMGAAQISGKQDELEHARTDVERSLRAWVKLDDAEALLRLRAVQQELFVAAFRAWQKDPTQQRELDELGGNLPSLMRDEDWLDEQRRFVGDDRILRLLYRLRFGRTLRLDRHPFAATLNDLRLYHRFRLRTLEEQTPQDDKLLAVEERVVAAVGQVDSTYPTQIALGVLAFRSGRFADAQGLFSAYLKAHPTGRWGLRVQNYLAASIQQQQ